MGIGAFAGRGTVRIECAARIGWAMQPRILDSNSHAGLGGPRSLFLSLYLVLLGFFVVLFSLSTLEETRTRAVVGSLTATFAGPQGPSLETAFPSRSGDVLGGARSMVVDMGALFQAEIPAVDVRVMSAGSLLVADLPARALFVPATDRLRPGHDALFDRIVAGLSRPPAGVRMTLSVIGLVPAVEVGAPVPGASADPAPDSGPDAGAMAATRLAVKRAAALAQALHARGAPADVLSAGITEGSADRLSLRLTVIQGDEDGDPAASSGAKP